MHVNLEGQVAVVTGASGGLGERFARLLSEAGAKVAVVARRMDRIKAVAEELSTAGRKVAAFQLDVADAAAIGPCLDEIERALGPISILVNNAGVSGEGMALDLPVESWDNTFNVNVRGVFVASREAARRMIASGVAERGDARIVNIASIASHSIIPGTFAYNASKAAVAMLTRSLAREWARQRIAVNALCPGFIVTDINAGWFDSEGGRKQVARFPRRRLMQSSDLDMAFMMLAGPAASAITGTLVTVDDGQSLGGL
jgi:NAD(P)-dependent dehydrogenase (short-subunit alcohol dehydrogenase family)